MSNKTNKKTKIVFILTLFLLSVISFFFLTSFNEKNSSQLLNTTWKVVQFNGEEINEQILFSIESGSVGFSICNSIGYGKIKITKDKIYFHSEAFSTMMACDEPLMSLESSFVNTFNEPFNYVFENENLILTNGRDEILFIPYDSSFDGVSNSRVLLEKEDSVELDLQRREAIQEAYPEFVVDYEEQPCFAGCSVNVVEEDRDYYYAYITHASGLPVGVATCFRVDPTMRVYKVGEFPDMTDSYIGYKDVDSKTCKGIK